MILQDFKSETRWLDADFDERKREVVYSIPFEYMTKAAFKQIRSEIKEMYPEMARRGCGHDWDCCGCVFMVDVDTTFTSKGVVIVITEHLNY